MTHRHEFLDEAKNALFDRGRAYGHPAVNHQRIASLWSTYLEYPVKAEDVAICMTLVKIARLIETKNHEDSYLDLVAYSAIAGELATMDWEDFNASLES
jgi:hypothetical protein